MNLEEKYNKYLSLLDNGKSFNLDWITAGTGKNIGIRVWVNTNSNQAVFTNLYDGINEEVVNLSDKRSIARVIENYVSEGH